MPKTFGTNPGGGSGEIEVGVTPSDGTANTLLKTNATGEVADATGLTQNAGGALVIANLGVNVPKIQLGTITGDAGIKANGVGVGDGGFWEVGAAGSELEQRLTNTGGGFAFAMLGSSTNFSVSPQGVEAFRIDANAVAGNTRMMLWDVNNGTLERVSVGVDDSGGAGFRLLRIPNTSGD